MFYALCTVHPDKRNQMAQLRNSHLQYIKENLSNVQYGGVLVGDDENDIEGICYILTFDKNKIQKANNFVAGDPYYPLYSDVNIKPFRQRIPKL